MTNPTLPDHGAELSPELLALAPVGGKRRPVKVVQQPAIRAARARLDKPFTVLRVPVVLLNRAPAPAACRCTPGDFVLDPQEIAAIDALDTGVRGEPDQDALDFRTFGVTIPE